MLKILLSHSLLLLQTIVISENFLLFLFLCISGLPLLSPIVSFIKKCLQLLGLPSFWQPVEIHTGIGYGTQQAGHMVMSSQQLHLGATPLDSCCLLACRIPRSHELPRPEVFPGKYCCSCLPCSTLARRQGPGPEDSLLIMQRVVKAGR